MFTDSGVPSTMHHRRSMGHS